MKLTGFRINSYRSCIRTTFPLNTELTTLIGVNSSGKSNILNGLLLLRKICNPKYSRRREQESSAYNKCFISVDMQYAKKTIRMKGDVTFETDDRNIDDVVSANLRWNFSEFIKQTGWINMPTEAMDRHHPYHNLYLEQLEYVKYHKSGTLKRQFLSRYPQVKIEFPPRQAMDLVLEVASFFGNIHYYSASQFSDPSRCPVFIELEEDRPVRRARQIVGHENFIFDLYQSWKAKDTHYNRYINVVGKDGIDLIHGIYFEEVSISSSYYDVKIGGRLTTKERQKRLVIPRFKVDKLELSPNQLSEGTFKTLALLFYLLSDDGKLLLIEEPEVCIHHGLLSSIIELIKRQSTHKQIIMSTHSDFVLDNLRPENLLLITRQPDVGTTAKTLTKAMTKDDYSALRSYLQDTGNLGEYWKDSGFENA